MKKIKLQYLPKLIILTLVGFTSFMIPFSFLGDQTLVSYISNFFLMRFDHLLTYMVAILIFASLGLSLFSEFSRKHTPISQKIIEKYRTKPIYILTKIIAAIIAIILLFDIKIDIVNNVDTGKNMLQLSKSLVTIAIALSYILPILTNCGIMEFFGVLTQDLIQPLFKVPGVAAVDLITSWFGASNAEVIMAREKYHKGYYSKRDAANIMSNFSLVSVSFVYIVSEATHFAEDFTTIFVVAAFVSIVLAIIMPRIYPLNKISDEYYHQPADYTLDPPKGYNKFTWGLQEGLTQSERFEVSTIIPEGTNVLLSIWFDLVPIVLAWGTVGLILAYYTPIFQVVTYPIALGLQAIGIEEAFIAAPATLIGFIDMFIPSVLVSNVQSNFTRFVIVELSLVQMIYMTEIGAVILQSEIDIDFKKLVLIFLERTLLAFPLIYLCARYLYG
uniref:YjiH family protein n=1 Tax=Globicatella sulfidifaciens TaxID=136093 RepID=UPI0023F04492|nr:nucleoside recognition domain-containing protein [Globicatella sulfidifaciens]